MNSFTTFDRDRHGCSVQNLELDELASGSAWAFVRATYVVEPHDEEEFRLVGVRDDSGSEPVRQVFFVVSSEEEVVDTFSEQLSDTTSDPRWRGVEDALNHYR